MLVRFFSINMVSKTSKIANPINKGHRSLVFWNIFPVCCFVIDLSVITALRGPTSSPRGPANLLWGPAISLRGPASSLRSQASLDPTNDKKAAGLTHPHFREYKTELCIFPPSAINRAFLALPREMTQPYLFILPIIGANIFNPGASKRSVHWAHSDISNGLSTRYKYIFPLVEPQYLSPLWTAWFLCTSLCVGYLGP